MKRCIGIIICLLCLVPSHSRATEVHLSIAASLREVINELSDNFARNNPGVRFIRNYGASGVLAKQIENGAPADLFISANPEWMEYLMVRKAVNEKDSSTFTYNSLVFVGKPLLQVNSLQGIVVLDKIAIGSPLSVPAGEYAIEAFQKAGLEKQLEKKLVRAKDVREAMMYAERGEVDGAFVYRTDALQTAKNTRILFAVPQELYPRVTYPMALTASGSKKSGATAFYRFLQSTEARSVLTRRGFITR